MQDKVVIEGYAPGDLIFRLRLIEWQECSPSGKNFLGIEFGNNVLADTHDPYCPFKHRITITEIPCGQVFQIEGYTVENLCAGVRNGFFIPVAAGCMLDNLPLGKIANVIPYRMTVEFIT